MLEEASGYEPKGIIPTPVQVCVNQWHQFCWWHHTTAHNTREKGWSEELTYDFEHELIQWPLCVQQVKDAEEVPEDEGVLASVTAAVSAPVVAAVPTMSHAESQPAQKVEEKTPNESPKVTAAEQEVFGQNVLLWKPY